MGDQGSKRNSPWIRTAVIFLAVIFLVLPAANAIGYEVIFHWGFRDGTSEDIPETADRKVLFPDGYGHELAGFFYGEHNPDPLALVVFAHGISSNHLEYADLIRRLLSEGYAVFAYDASGYGASGRGGSGGLPHGVRDMRAALDYVKSLEAFRDVPVVVSGHSYGAYAAGAALESLEDADLAVLVAPFNASTDMMQQGAERYLGSLVSLMMPYVKLYEGIKYGADSARTVVDGLVNSRTRTLILFGAQDDSISPEYGFILFEDALSGSDLITIQTLQDSTHRMDKQMIEEILSFINQNILMLRQEAS
ncbi:MAG: alpha/beta fold hydrolase [Lachnospiraceae bacterium]|nr:alpha/beta fold hydrolase [Lachnospiraceae bacterium]MBR5738624.1 alpha/beta fold hydrolase [Lachnospiraceae bacterium]